MNAPTLAVCVSCTILPRGPLARDRDDLGKLSWPGDFWDIEDLKKLMPVITTAGAVIFCNRTKTECMLHCRVPEEGAEAAAHSASLHTHFCGWRQHSRLAALGRMAATTIHVRFDMLCFFFFAVWFAVLLIWSIVLATSVFILPAIFVCAEGRPRSLCGVTR